MILRATLEYGHKRREFSFPEGRKTCVFKSGFPNGTGEEMSESDSEGQEIGNIAQMFDHDNFSMLLAEPMAFLEKSHFLFLRPYFMDG